MHELSRGIMRGALTVSGVALAAYAAHVAVTWLRFGRPAHVRRPEERDSLLDQLMPEYDIVDRHEKRVAAPPEVTLNAAKEMDLNRSRIVRAIFRVRQLFMRGTVAERSQSRGLVADATGWGWGVLAEVPGRELVLGAVTKPWEANVEFRAVASTEFARFQEPGFVKIVWTLRADPIGARGALFRSETRAVATESESRRRFRRYWALVSPGVRIIRRMMLGPLEREAQRRAMTT